MSRIVEQTKWLSIVVTVAMVESWVRQKSANLVVVQNVQYPIGVDMLEMIERLASDRLWLYTSIIGSLLGAAVLAYLSTTRIGLWGYSKFDTLIDYLVARWNLTWLEQPEDAWRKRYPKITEKIDDLQMRIEKIEKEK